MEGVADLEELVLAAFGTASPLSLGLGDTAPFWVRDGDLLSTAGDAGDSELEDVDEVAARLFGLRSLSKPGLEAFFLDKSCAVGLCLGSFAAGVWRGLPDSPGLSWLLLSAD